VQPISIVAPSSSSSSFPHSITEKLNDSNFLLWKQQIDPIITSHRMMRFLIEPSIPQQFLTDEDRFLGNFSTAYLAWEQQDAQLLTWLQSTLSKDVLLQMIGCKHSHQLWQRLHSDFFSKTEAKARHFREELRDVRLGGQGISEYLQKIKSLCDSLSSIGDSVSQKEHLDVVLGGLPNEYESLVNVVAMTRKFQMLTIQDVGALLLAQEARNEKSKKNAAADFVVNAATVGYQ
jgi:histone deacetylase 1/2